MIYDVSAAFWNRSRSKWSRTRCIVRVLCCTKTWVGNIYIEKSDNVPKELQNHDDALHLSEQNFFLDFNIMKIKEKCWFIIISRAGYRDYKELKSRRLQTRKSRFDNNNMERGLYRRTTIQYDTSKE